MLTPLLGTAGPEFRSARMMPVFPSISLIRVSAFCLFSASNEPNFPTEKQRSRKIKKMPPTYLSGERPKPRSVGHGRKLLALYRATALH